MIEYNVKYSIDIIRSGKSLHQDCPNNYNVIIHDNKVKYPKLISVIISNKNIDFGLLKIFFSYNFDNIYKLYIF